MVLLDNDFIRNNSERAHDAFYKKDIYRGVLQRQKKSIGRNLIDFSFAERVLHGKINMYYVPISLQSRNLKHAPASVSQVHTDSPRVAAVNFVMDAFTEMAKQFEKAAASGKISRSEKYLSNLKIHKAYEDPHKKYSEYYRIYSSSIIAYMVSDKYASPITSFEEFVDLLIPRIQRSLRTHPITKTAFVKSQYCPPTCSGLVIEIADLPYTSDRVKMEHFVNNKNWEFFVKTCSSYGFLIDQNVPWRIVANIGNPKYMELYASRYNMSNSKQTFFNRYYEVVHERYYRSFKYYLLELYNRIRSPMVRKEQYCSVNGSVATWEQSRSYDIDAFKDKFPEEYFLRLYFTIRFLEEESKFTEQEQEELISDLLSFYNTSKASLNRCLYFFEHIVNKTFDYVGSLSYINKAINARREHEEQEMMEIRQQRPEEGTMGIIDQGTIPDGPDRTGLSSWKSVDGEIIGESALDLMEESARTSPFSP